MGEQEENEVDKTTTKKDIEQHMHGDERKKTENEPTNAIE